MPGSENIGIFKDMIDLIAYYKYNAIILEIGGAMEYKKHPEINEKWVEACNEAHRYSGRAQEIQKKTHPWEKNSIHCDNGDGGFLTQDECHDIASYCRERGLEVIPE
jgi:hexosaminidase